MALWEKNLRRVTPYVPGEQPKEQNIIKLNTNENPYGPAPEVSRILSCFDADSLRKYPDPEASLLVKQLSATYGVPEESIFVGVGSDDVLAMSFLTFFAGEGDILFPDVTYSFYDVWAQMIGISYKTIPLHEDFTWAPEDYEVPNQGIVLANPNAPTGLMAPLSDIRKVLEKNPGSVVIVDEAYVDFGGESTLPLIQEYDNLLIVRTFSKSRSLAGSRIGFAFGSRQLIKALSDVKFSFNSYTMDSVTLQVGAASLRDQDYFQDCVQKIITTREESKKRFSDMGFSFPDSSTNFLLVTHKDMDIPALYEYLRDKHIYVRHFNAPRLNDYLRVTIGLPEEMDQLFAAISQYMKG